MPNPEFYNTKISAELGALISNYGAYFGGEQDLMTMAMDVLIMQPDGYVRRSYQSDDPDQNREFVITKPEKVAKVTSVLSFLLEKVRTALNKTDKEKDPYTHAILSICSSDLSLILGGTDINLLPRTNPFFNMRSGRIPNLINPSNFTGKPPVKDAARLIEELKDPARELSGFEEANLLMKQFPFASMLEKLTDNELLLERALHDSDKMSLEDQETLRQQLLAGCLSIRADAEALSELSDEDMDVFSKIFARKERNQAKTQDWKGNRGIKTTVLGQLDNIQTALENHVPFSHLDVMIHAIRFSRGLEERLKVPGLADIKGYDDLQEEYRKFKDLVNTDFSTLSPEQAAERMNQIGEASRTLFQTAKTMKDSLPKAGPFDIRVLNKMPKDQRDPIVHNNNLHSALDIHSLSTGVMGRVLSNQYIYSKLEGNVRLNVMGARPQENRINVEVNDGDNFINEPGQENIINNQPLNHINNEQAQEPVNNEQAQEPVNNEQLQEPVNNEQPQEPVNNEQLQEPVNNEQAQEPGNNEQLQENVNVQPQIQPQEPVNNEQPQENVNVQPQVQPQENVVQPQEPVNVQPQANIGQPQVNVVQPQVNVAQPQENVVQPQPPANYSEVLRTLGDTESFWQRETKGYKDFRTALTNLNNGMRAAGDRALNPADVQKLRGLAAKAKESYDLYWAQLWTKIDEMAERGVNRISDTDRRRGTILQGMRSLLEGDLDALRNYDPTRNLNLPDLIQENRGLTADIRGRNVQVLSGNVSSRMVLEVNGRKGIFTEDYEIQSPERIRERQYRRYPQLAPLLESLHDNLFKSFTLENVEQLEQKILEKSDERVNNIIDLIVNLYQEPGNIQFPQVYNRPDGKVWFENPAFVHDFADAASQIIIAAKTTLPAELAQIDTGRNVPRRNAAMSMVADRLGMPHLLARSKVMKVETGQGTKTGVFMEWAEGTDLVSKQGKLIPELMGKPRKTNTADVLKSAADLQVLDYICGNTDRHGGNIFYRFEERDGVLCLVGLQGIDNDTSMGRKSGNQQLGKEATPDTMRVMTRSAAEAVLRMTKEDLRYSLYGLVKDEEIEAAWQRTEALQNKIRESAKVKWKYETSVRPGAIRILDDNSPVWGRLELDELAPNSNIKESGGIFAEVADAVKLIDAGEEQMGLRYAPHTRAGIRKEHYSPTTESTLYDYLTVWNYPRTGPQLSDADIFSFYRNRKTLQNDQAAIQKAKRLFERSTQLFRWGDGQIHTDMGWTDKVDAVYIDGLPVAEYVRKYSPENAGNKDYQKAQVMAALTSGRHHVDMAIIRTTEDGSFKVSTTELTMDLSALNRHEHIYESSRENRRKSLIKDETARIQRQYEIEKAVLSKAKRTAYQKVEELISQDPERDNVCRAIPYAELYRKGPDWMENRIDQGAVQKEKRRVETRLREVENRKFNDVKQAFAGNPAPAPAPQNAQGQAQNAQGQVQNVQGQAQNVWRREAVSLDALNLPEPRRRPQNQPNQLPNQQNQPQNQPVQQQNQPNPQQNQAAHADENHVRRTQSFNGGRRRV